MINIRKIAEILPQTYVTEEEKNFILKTLSRFDIENEVKLNYELRSLAIEHDRFEEEAKEREGIKVENFYDGEIFKAKFEKIDYELNALASVWCYLAPFFFKKDVQQEFKFLFEYIGDRFYDDLSRKYFLVDFGRRVFKVNYRVEKDGLYEMFESIEPWGFRNSL